MAAECHDPATAPRGGDPAAPERGDDPMTAERGARARATPGAVLALLCSAQFLVVLDVTIVAVALPELRGALGFSAAGLQWVVTAYTLTFGGLLVAAGRVADLAGRRRVLRIGLVAFGSASLACGLAPSAAALVAARAVQGVGAAMVAPAALALLGAAFPEPAARRRAVAWWTAAAAGGGASGWVLGGLLVEGLGWPAVFLVNVPICAAAALLAPQVLVESRAPSLGLGLARALTVTAGLALLVHGLTQRDLLTLAAAALALGAFAWTERRADDPFLPRRPAFTVAAGAALAITAATTPPMFLAVLYQQEELGRSALAIGLWCAPLNLSVIGASLLGQRLPVRVAMPAGLAAIAAGALLLGGGVLLPAFVIMGAGLGIASVASTASGTAALPEDQQGIASGVLNAAAQIGTVVGLAVLVGAGGGYAGAAGLALAAAAATRWWPRHGHPRLASGAG